MIATHYAQSRAARQGRPEPGPRLSFGVLYPRDNVVAVIDDYGGAVAAAGGLREQGIPEGDVEVLEGGSFLSLARAARRRLGLWQRLAALLSRLFSDDAADEQCYLEAAGQGHAILLVRAQRADVVERVAAVLGRYQAHDVRHYRRGTVEEIA